MKNKKQITNIDILDVTKFILSFVVVAIHSFGNYRLVPFVRIAVPVFFIISSYLFFRNVSEDTDIMAKLWKYLKRLLVLYFSWFIVLLPVTLYNKHVFEKDFFNVIKSLIIDLFFGGTFGASWYFSALFFGMIIVCIGYRLRINWLVMILGVFAYILCLFASNYSFLLPYVHIADKTISTYPSCIFNSFPVSIVWLSLGRLLAFKGKRRDIPLYASLICFIVSVILLWAEYSVIKNYVIENDSDDCYLLLIPVCYFLVDLLLRINISIKNAKYFRKCSTIIYCVHMSLYPILLYFLKLIGTDLYKEKSALLFIMLAGCSFAFANLLIWLQKFKCFKWLHVFW